MNAKEIVKGALEIDPAQRSDYIARECGGSRSLLDEVLALLKNSLAPDRETVTIQFRGGEVHEGSIGPYELIQKLGEGGMGVVYHARQQHPIRRDLAIKVIKPGMDSKEVISRFENERQALAMMDHPNIARVFDAGTTSAGRPYFVMELVDGVPITRYCDSKRLTVRQRIELFIPVCKAIQHAHQKGIIHRDIKPSNVLVKQHEDYPMPVVIDFGLAKALGEHLSDATILTNIGAVVGTLNYMSPEQAELGRQDIDTRSDVYSLGALLYELLTGAPPLDNETGPKASYLEILRRIKDEEAKPPSVRLRHSATLKIAATMRQSDEKRLPKLLEQEPDWIVMKALEKDRTRRYETVNGMVRDLQRYLAGQPVEAGPPSTAYRVGKFIRRHRLGLTTAVAFAVVLMAGAAVSAWMAVRASRAEREAQAVNAFLRNDLLSQAGASAQARSGGKPDPDIKVRTLLDRAAARIEGKFDTQPLVEAAIRQTIGNAYAELGLYPMARQQLERTLDLRSRELDANHPDRLNVMQSLGSTLLAHGKSAEAEPLFREIFEVRRRRFGEEHPETVSAKSNLGATYSFQGKFAQAEPLFHEVQELRRRTLGEEHPRTLTAMDNLASVYYNQGKYAEAEPLNARSTKIAARVLGEEHPTTLTMMVHRAKFLRLRGDYRAAETLLTKAQETQRRVLGENHRNTIFGMNSLARLYLSQGKYLEARNLYGKARAIGLRGLGEEHTFTMDSYFGLAESQVALGKQEEAAGLLVKVLEVQGRVLGEDHPAATESRALLGDVRLRQRNFNEAEILLRKALSSYEKTNPDRWERYRCQNMLGESLARRKEFVEAEPLLLAGYDGLVQRQAGIPVSERQALQDAGQRVVRLYQEWGKADKVAEWKRKLQANISSGTPREP